MSAPLDDAEASKMRGYPGPPFGKALLAIRESTGTRSNTPAEILAWACYAGSRGVSLTGIEWAVRLGCSPKSIGDHARRLESAGLVTITRHGRAASVICPTDSGIALIEAKP